MIPETIDVKDWFISTFNNYENRLNGHAEQPFHQLRREAIAHFSRLDFPNTRMEEWKYTNLQPLLDQRFQLFDDDHNLKPASFNVISERHWELLRAEFMISPYCARRIDKNCRN